MINQIRLNKTFRSFFAVINFKHESRPNNEPALNVEFYEPANSLTKNICLHNGTISISKSGNNYTVQDIGKDFFIKPSQNRTARSQPIQSSVKTLAT